MRIAQATILMAAVSLASSLPAQDIKAPAAPKAPAANDPVSYAIGIMVGRNLGGDGFLVDDFKPQDFMNGVRDGMAGRPNMSNEQMSQVMQQIDQVLQQRAAAREDQMQKARQAIAGPNLEKSRKFLETNSKKAGVKMLASGLQYAIIKNAEGNAASPKATDTVMVHYTGKNVDGKVFDSSVERGMPAKIVVSQVVPGWVEGLQLMKVGEKWMLFLPPDLAYGDRGVPSLGPDGQPVIGPNEALVFEVELLSIVAP